MICPMYGMDCKCDASKPLQCHTHEIASPPKPTMAEIERLVDQVIYDSCNASLQDGEESRAALLAAIRAYGEGK